MLAEIIGRVELKSQFQFLVLVNDLLKLTKYFRLIHYRKRELLDFVIQQLILH